MAPLAVVTVEEQANVLAGEFGVLHEAGELLPGEESHDTGDHNRPRGGLRGDAGKLSLEERERFNAPKLLLGVSGVMCCSARLVLTRFNKDGRLLAFSSDFPR